jgi:hypothetical protein
VAGATARDMWDPPPYGAPSRTAMTPDGDWRHDVIRGVQVQTSATQDVVAVRDDGVSAAESRYGASGIEARRFRGRRM